MGKGSSIPMGHGMLREGQELREDYEMTKMAEQILQKLSKRQTVRIEKLLTALKHFSEREGESSAYAKAILGEDSNG